MSTNFALHPAVFELRATLQQVNSKMTLNTKLKASHIYVTTASKISLRSAL